MSSGGTELSQISNLSSASSTLTNKTPTNSTSQHTSENLLLSNGILSPGSNSLKSPVLKQPPKKAPRKNIPNICTCKCAPKDFEKSQLSPDELIHGTVKILDNVSDLESYRINSRLQYRNIRYPNESNKTSPTNSNQSQHDKCKCTCNGEVKSRADDKSPFDDIEDWSHMLIDLAQISPAAKLVHIDPFDAVPKISVVPPTPEGITSSMKYRYV
jgi:hypothetical protein